MTSLEKIDFEALWAHLEQLSKIGNGFVYDEIYVKVVETDELYQLLVDLGHPMPTALFKSYGKNVYFYENHNERVYLGGASIKKIVDKQKHLQARYEGRC